MKAKLLLAGLILLIMVSVSMAQTGVIIVTPPSNQSTSKQVACSGTATLLYSGPRSSITMENFTAASVAVYLSPRSDASTSNAGLQLSSTLITYYIDDKGQDDWYCVTAGSGATVGVTIRK